MPSLSIDDLTQRLLSLDLLSLDQIRDVERSFGSQLFTSEQFLQALQRYGYLTKYQVERLAAGETTGFYYGDYRIQYLVGAGSFARVFRCVHKDTGKVVAVKVLRARFRDDQTAINEFEREGEMGMELRHPNIAAVYEAKKTKYDHYMVMEFVEGRTLREDLGVQKNGRIEPKRATRIVYDVASALDYALKRGYQHRDMKLTNIMLASSGKAVLLDFGLLTDEASGFKTQRAIEYAALERSTHVRRDDKRSDVYFLASVYYQILTGIAPLGEIKERAKRLDASRFKNVKRIREVAPYVPRCVATVVDKALNFRPEERYQSPEDFLRDLDRVIKTLEKGEEEEETQVAPKSDVVSKASAPKATKTIMIVEANGDLQNAFRQSFKNAGFRALVVSNAKLALTRLEDFAVDLVLFNAQSLGKEAVEAFNALLDVAVTRELPAVLLLDENQVKWGASAKRSKRRVAVGMPITMKRLLMVVDKLTTPEPEKKEKTTPTEEAVVETPPTSSKPTEVEAPKRQDASNVDPKQVDKKQDEEEQDDVPLDAFDAALDDAFERFVANKATATHGAAAAREEREAKTESELENEDDSYYLDEDED